MIPVIPSRSNGRRCIRHGEKRCRDRWRTEAMVCRLRTLASPPFGSAASPPAPTRSPATSPRQPIWPQSSPSGSERAWTLGPGRRPASLRAGRPSPSPVGRPASRRALAARASAARRAGQSRGQGSGGRARACGRTCPRARGAAPARAGGNRWAGPRIVRVPARGSRGRRGLADGLPDHRPGRAANAGAGGSRASPRTLRRRPAGRDRGVARIACGRRVTRRAGAHEGGRRSCRAASGRRAGGGAWTAGATMPAVVRPVGPVHPPDRPAPDHRQDGAAGPLPAARRPQDCRGPAGPAIVEGPQGQAAGQPSARQALAGWRQPRKARPCLSVPDAPGPGRHSAPACPLVPGRAAAGRPRRARRISRPGAC